MARAAVNDIESRGHRALLVGGTGLYVQAVLDDLRLPGEDLDLRVDLEAETAEPGGVARRLRAAPGRATRRRPRESTRTTPAGSSARSR